MTVSTARKNGFSVNDQIARNQQKAIGAFIEMWRERVLQGVGIGGETGTVSYILTGLAAENYPPDAATDAMARYLQSQQWPDGRWRQFSHRPPIMSGDIQVTATSLRSLQVYAPGTQRAKYEMDVKRGADWLMKAQPKTTDERAFSASRARMGWRQPEQRTHQGRRSRLASRAASRRRLGSTRVAAKRLLCNGSGISGIETGWRPSRDRSILQTRDRVPAEDTTRRWIVVREDPCHPTPAVLRKWISLWT